MNVKIDTKERFTVISPTESALTANMTDEMEVLLHERLKNKIPHTIINFQFVSSIDEAYADKLTEWRAAFMENDVSLVMCGLADPVKKNLEELDLLDLLNYAPTESEAWDIVQMEEIERELLSDDD